MSNLQMGRGNGQASYTMRLRQLCFIGTIFFVSPAVQIFAADALWKFELERVQRAISTGQYREALQIARTFEQEFAETLRKIPPREFRQKWRVYEMAEIWTYLLRATCERYTGNYGVASSRLSKAMRELKEMRLRDGKIYDELTSQFNNQDFVREWNEQVTLNMFEARLARWKMQRLRPMIDAASAAIKEYDELMLMVCDASAAILMDEAMPLRKDSALLLRKAEVLFEDAQKIRERDFQGVSYSMTIHGDHRTTFYRNYGRLFLKQAELAIAVPGMADRVDIDAVLARAGDYISRARHLFAEWDAIVDEYRGLVHEGSIGNANKALKQKLAELGLKDNEATLFLEDLKTVFVGYSDLCFVQSEWNLVSARRAAERGDEIAAEELLSEAEQLLLDGSDMLAMVSPRADHPNLVICYAEAAALAAIRAKILGEPLDPESEKYIEMAEDIVQSRGLGPDTIQVKYLKRAKDLCEIDEGEAAGG